MVGEGSDGTIYRALENARMSDSGDAYLIVGEDADFNTKTFGVAKNATGYAPKFYVMAKIEDDTSDGECAGTPV